MQRNFCAATCRPLARRGLSAEASQLARRRGERRDSVNEATLRDRRLHMLRIESGDIAPSRETVAEIKRLGLGRQKGWQNPKNADRRRASIASGQNHKAVLIGHARSSTLADWAALNRECLPEVALLGHSNCGKSALVNALSGAPVRSGLASVSPRAGWTAELAFYRTRPHEAEAKRAGEAVAREGRRRRGGGGGAHGDGAAEQDAAAAAPRASGVLLVDTPGYGFAVGDRRQLDEWAELLAQYLGHAQRLELAVLLIDCTRGLCAEDRRVLGRLSAARVPVLPVLTKADLLPPADLACSHAIVTRQLADATAPPAEVAADADAPQTATLHAEGAAPRPLVAVHRPLMVSSHFYSGVRTLWRHIQQPHVLAPRETPR